jgi:hypothetical protein
MQSLFVGVDVSKDYFCASGLDVQGNEMFSLTASADKTGFAEMIGALTSHCISLDEVMVAMESTAFIISIYFLFWHPKTSKQWW